MASQPILLLGGAGMVGRWTARFLRAAHPDTRLLIGGRDLEKARQVAAEVGAAEGVAIDVTAADLGLGDRPIGAVAAFFTDASLGGLHFAQARGVPHVGISTALHAIAPEVAAYVRKPEASAIVLGTEWLVGAATIPALRFAADFGRIDDINIGALIDEVDIGGPEQALDYDRAANARPAALSRRDGGYFWRAGDEAFGGFRAADGTPMEGAAMSLVDVVGLAEETGASNVQLNLAVGVSSTRRRGEAMSTEIIIELAGEDHAGQPLRTRHAVIFPGGQLPLTGLGVALVVERLVGLGGREPTPPGLYFPYQLLAPDTYFARLAQAGGQVLQLDVL
jgi:hypothetical protein